MSNRKTRRKNSRRAKERAQRSKPSPPPRLESEIFDDLKRLCVSPGFIHAIALICYRDNTVGFKEVLTSDDLVKMYSDSRLIRTEVSTLIGLMGKAPIDFALPAPEALSTYIETAERLLDELHRSMSKPMFEGMTPALAANPEFNPFANANVMREPIFYGNELAYSFQYRAFSEHKYSNDTAWLKKNRGVDYSLAAKIVKTIGDLQNDKQLSYLKTLRGTHPSTWTMLPAFVIAPKEIAEAAKMVVEDVEAFLVAFSLPTDDLNPTFSTLSDYNATNAYPIIRKAVDEYVLLQYVAMTEALYDTPFYWMIADKGYADAAQRNRGNFAEEFCTQRLEKVFGREHVLRGVRIFEEKGKEVGEIDTLVLFRKPSDRPSSQIQAPDYRVEKRQRPPAQRRFQKGGARS